MELGNAIFGHSTRPVPVPRSWQGHFMVLVNVVYKYPWVDKEFDCELFTLRPYYFDPDCTCGWDYIDNGHESIYKLEHRPDCYQHAYAKLVEKYGYGHDEKFYKELRAIYEQYGIEPAEGDKWWCGCAMKCTCDYYERMDAIYERYAEEFGHMGHRDDCAYVLPNFVYKPTGYELEWYKYPLRDSYANMEVSEKEFIEMILKCVEYYISNFKEDE